MTQSPGVNMYKPRRVYPSAALVVLLGVGGLLATVAFARNGHLAPANALMLISLALIGGGPVHNRRRRQREWFHRTFRTYENFRAEVIDEVRRVRQEKGDAAIVRHLRTGYPHLPVRVITRLIAER
ncbi:hypothetical protein [Streptomyces sp. NPDC048611]|uniref:hypothetical protein n=1 Tax=Streptomyces sp. NPDC048611 TaxID=3155635 RepID=UPI00342C3619